MLDALRAHNFSPYGRARPAGTALGTAVPCILLIRMRSQVQVLAGPPHPPDSRNAACSYCDSRLERIPVRDEASRTSFC
jgi:hypothetical protein